jgi:acyl CoA:acetate/3-ketoacid CoA transferase beta subunit
MRRLPGGLAHADIACLIGRLVAYRAGNDKRFLPEEVDFVTGAAGRVATIVTAAAVLDWDGERFRLASVHAGVTRDEAIAGCGFALDAPALVPVTEIPPPEAIRLLREEIDPHSMRRLETREGRADALRELEAMS